MSIQIPIPNTLSGSDHEGLLQIQSYLYRMAQQLQWAFDTIGSYGVASVSSDVKSQGKGQSEKDDPAATFAGLKDLIIKSSDIVNAYYETISKKLEGAYVTQSDFGTYTQNTALDIQENSAYINQIFSNIQEITDTVDELYNNTVGTNAYLKSGLLYEDEDGIPVYGLEIGQTNQVNGENVFDKFARFSAERLSFFDRNDTEVAYISDYKLYVTNAEITGGLWLSGRFKIYFNQGLAFQWMGGNA